MFLHQFEYNYLNSNIQARNLISHSWMYPHDTTLAFELRRFLSGELVSSSFASCSFPISHYVQSRNFRDLASGSSANDSILKASWLLVSFVLANNNPSGSLSRRQVWPYIVYLLTLLARDHWKCCVCLVLCW